MTGIKVGGPSTLRAVQIEAVAIPRNASECGMEQAFGLGYMSGPVPSHGDRKPSIPAQGSFFESEGRRAAPAAEL